MNISASSHSIIFWIFIVETTVPTIAFPDGSKSTCVSIVIIGGYGEKLIKNIEELLEGVEWWKLNILWATTIAENQI